MFSSASCDAKKKQESTLKNNLPNISAAKISAVLTMLADQQPRVEVEGPSTNYTFKRGDAKLVLAIKGGDGHERLTRAVLVLGTDDSSAEVASLLSLSRPNERTSLEFCDQEGERLDVYAPRLRVIDDSVTILGFIKLPLVA